MQSSALRCCIKQCCLIISTPQPYSGNSWLMPRLASGFFLPSKCQDFNSNWASDPFRTYSYVFNLFSINVLLLDSTFMIS